MHTYISILTVNSFLMQVASILSDKRKKMLIFEMEIEDDEDEIEMSQNSMLDISKESAVS